MKSDAAVNSEFMCMGSNLDYTTGSSNNNFNYCIRPCQSRVEPVQRNPSPDFCYHLYSGSFIEIIFSYLAFIPNLIEENLRGFKEYNFCPADVVNDDGSCPSPIDSSAGCRPDGKGVWSLPPGDSSCLIFLNGHGWPVGATLLTAVTALAGSSFLGGVVTLGGVSSISSSCPSTFFCQVGGKCCRFIFMSRVTCLDITNYHCTITYFICIELYLGVVTAKLS